MGLFKKTIKAGEKIPAFYAPVKRGYANDSLEVALVPFSLFIAWGVYLWANIRRAHIDIIDDPRVAYNQGYKDGKKDERNSA